MIKRKIEKSYLNNHFPGLRLRMNKNKEKWKLEKVIDKKFDEKGNCIKIYEKGEWYDVTTKFKYDNHGNCIQEDWCSILKSSITTYNNKYDSEGNLIGYEKTCKKFDNPWFSIIEEETFSTCEIELEHDKNNLLTKSREIHYGNDRFINHEEIVINEYDNSGELIKKNKETKGQSKDGKYFNFRVEKFKYFFDDKGEKLEQVDKFISQNKELEPKFDGKTIIKHNERIYFNRDNKVDQKLVFSYNNDGLIIKSEHHFEGRGIENFREFEYEY